MHLQDLLKLEVFFPLPMVEGSKMVSISAKGLKDLDYLSRAEYKNTYPL
jgi:hypothetical protein